MTREHFEALKHSLFMGGIDEIEEFLDMEVPYDDKDTIDNLLNLEFESMDEETLTEAYQKYCSDVKMVAINIDWDVDNEEDLEDLPTEIEIPSHLTDEDEISDYISDKTGFCHGGFDLVART